MSIKIEDISIEDISLPLAGILLSNSIHKAVLLGHQIDAGAVIFEHSPNQYYLNSVSGFSKKASELETLFTDLCIDITESNQYIDAETKPFRLNIDEFNLLNDLMMEENFTKVHVFKIHDLLNVSGYWIIFYRNKDVINNTLPLSHSLDSPSLIESLKQTIKQESESASIDEIINNWINVLDIRDKETEVHTLRVAEMACQLAKKYGLRGSELENIRRGALLHDIGKIVIPNEILHKPGPLTKEEWKIMRLHPEIGKHLLSGFDIPEEALAIPLYHHERWSGFGYPAKLSNKDIPLFARLFAVVDVWDALNSKRPYREPLSKDKAIKYIIDNSSVMFDPKITRLFFEMFSDKVHSL